jgi:hypothetical protein
MGKSVVILFTYCFILVTAEAQVTLSIHSNGETSDTIFQNQSLLIFLNISNARAQEAQRWNLAGERRLNNLREQLRKNEITQDVFDNEKALIESTRKEVSEVLVGTASQPWYQQLRWEILLVNIPIAGAPMIMPNPPTSATLKLGAESFYSVAFGLADDAIRRLQPGRYQVRAFLGNEASNTISLHVKSGNHSGNTYHIREGLFSWHQNDAVAVLSHAGKILESSPFSLDGLVLQGDGYVLQKSYLPALESYNKALKEYYRLYGSEAEPPEYLMTMIAHMKTNLGEPLRAQ